MIILQFPHKLIHASLLVKAMLGNILVFIIFSLEELLNDSAHASVIGL
jgi:hypothetical protein